jgi:pimeloyl-ACP methyl ester carboxylesterase
MKSATMVFLGFLSAGLIGGGAWLWTPDKPRSMLEPKYLAGPGDYVEAAGMRLHVRDSGRKDAPAVLLMHGFGASLHTWEPWAQMLAADFRVIRFDLPGAGLTGVDPTSDYTDARSLEVVLALMDKLGVARASVVGNSIGGRIAWKLAAQHPGRVDKLVLISPDGFESAGFEYGKQTHLPVMFRLMRYALPKPVLRMTLASAYGNRDVLTDEQVTRYHDLMLAPGVREASIARLEQTLLEPPEPWLRQIRVPTLLLWGAKDAIIPVANAADYQKSLPQSTLVVLPGLGHVPHEEAPAVSLPVVREFLSR